MLKRKTVLCIDDDIECLELIEIALNRRGFSCISASGGLAGLDKLHEFEPDLILLDLMMPDLSGWRVYRRVKCDEKLSRIPVIIVTAKDDPADKAMALEMARVDGYVTKPFKLSDLLEHVYTILGRQPLENAWTSAG